MLCRLRHLVVEQQIVLFLCVLQISGILLPLLRSLLDLLLAFYHLLLYLRKCYLQVRKVLTGVARFILQHRDGLMRALFLFYQRIHLLL